MKPPEPLYRQIARQVTARIQQRLLMPGDRLPSERELCAEFQVQRNTVRQAISLLVEEGRVLVEGRRGVYVLPFESASEGGVFVVNFAPDTTVTAGALLEGFTRTAEQQGYVVRRTATVPAEDSFMNRVPVLDGLPPDTKGVALWPSFPLDVDRLQALAREVPVVLVDRRVTGLSLDCVRFDDFAGGRVLTEHLLSLGHRRIAFLTDEVFAESVQDRWRGYVSAHEAAGVYLDHRLSLLYQMMDMEILGSTMRLLHQHPETRPTAIQCSNDLVAFTLLRYLHTEGIRVPQDVSIVGYGNSIPDYAEAMTLTTVDQSFSEAGEQAAALLTARVRARDLETPLVEKTLPVSLIVRGSTSSPAAL